MSPILIRIRARRDCTGPKDFYPISVGSGEWFLWEFPLAYWLEANGYDVTYVSNIDTHSGAARLHRAKGFLSVGHDEYYSIEMYQNLRRSIASGLNVAFLSGNT